MGGGEGEVSTLCIPCPTSLPSANFFFAKTVCGGVFVATEMYFSTSICVEGWVGVIMDRNENNIIGRSLKQCSP